jgi:serine/threonine protein kinase
MGSVWEALENHKGDENVSTDVCRFVALKILSDETMADSLAMARFQREAILASRVTGVHFPAIYDWGFHKRMAFLAMELLDGEDLAQILEARGTLTTWETLALVRNLGRALDIVHASGVVHRDVKPRNIFYAKQGGAHEIKLLDFGVAKPVVAGAIKITRTGAMVGSPYYMSPEQVTSGTIGPLSDLWSLAAVTFRALTGERPFDGPLEKALRDILTGSPPRAPAGLPRALDGFFARAFERAPEDRYPSGKALADAFEAALD